MEEKEKGSGRQSKGSRASSCRGPTKSFQAFLKVFSFYSPLLFALLFSPVSDRACSRRCVCAVGGWAGVNPVVLGRRGVIYSCCRLGASLLPGKQLG